MVQTLEGKTSAKELSFAIVVAKFNWPLSQRLLEGALSCLKENGASEERITIVKVPGSFEIPLAAKWLTRKKRYDAIICLGVIIKGETPHFRYVAGQASLGIGMAQMETEVPMAFGVITAEEPAHAAERAGGKKGNKGWEAALCAIEMATLSRQMQEIGTPDHPLPGSSQ